VPCPSVHPLASSTIQADASAKLQKLGNSTGKLSKKEVLFKENRKQIR